MNIRDFTVRTYDRLLSTAIGNGYSPLTVADYLRATELPSRFVVLRHDVDRKVSQARTMAQLEAEHDVESTYYVRTSTFDPAFVAELEELGHEVGYHYEDFTRSNGDRRRALDQFESNLALFRHHVDVETICPHGYPLSSVVNFDLFSDEHALREYDLLGDASLSIEMDDTDPTAPSYFTDTGRFWGAVDPTFGPVDTTDDLIELLDSGGCERLYLLAHPSRWSRSRTEHVERVTWDVAAESAKLTFETVQQVRKGTAAAGNAFRSATRPLAISSRVIGTVMGDR